MAGCRAGRWASFALMVLLSGPAWPAPAGQAGAPDWALAPDRAGERVMPTIPPDDDVFDPGVPSPDVETVPRVTPPTEIPTVEYDPEKLPTPVRRLREQIIEAAETGDIEKLRPIFDAHGEPPALSFNDTEDPIDTLRSLSGDEAGREILAILIEVLEAGYVHVDVGTPDEMYIWPYFARYPVDALTPRQIVELFKLVYSGDYEDMKTYGAYISYRIGIGPDGTWRFFLVGD
jgi:hypothetical protein